MHENTQAKIYYKFTSFSTQVIFILFLCIIFERKYSFVGI